MTDRETCEDADRCILSEEKVRQGKSSRRLQWITVGFLILVILILVYDVSQNQIRPIDVFRKLDALEHRIEQAADSVPAEVDRAVESRLNEPNDGP